MALTAEQQAQVDIQLAVENARNNNQIAITTKQAKLEAVRIAQQTLIENRRNQPVDAREVTAADITAYATTLMNYVNG
jgi:hypothetical protein